MSRCVVLTAAPLPDDAGLAAMKALLMPDDRFYAADHGWKLAELLGVTLDYLVGDGDSGDFPPNYDGKIKRLPTVKDETDTLAAVRLAMEHGFTDFLILGTLGGRFDHTLANLAVLAMAAAHGSAAMSDGVTWIEMLCPGRKTVLPRSGYVSLLPYGGAVEGLTVRNAAYEAENITLVPDMPLGVSNACTDKPMEITFTSGHLLLIFAKD